MKLSIVFLALVCCWIGLVRSECPNGCSGNGDCGKYDACSCYKGFQGNDCSERICAFGNAHADTPKGDLNMDGSVTTTAGTAAGSEMYPEGTYEKYNPAAQANEAHFYMECSNNGLCQRNTGECECFTGYEGNACQRQACPNGCSDHGVCMSISEFASKAGGTLFHRGVVVLDNILPVSYNLWDEKFIYGCKCDPWYTGADCSLRRCKVGLDPLYDDNQNIVYETFVVRAVSSDSLDATSYLRLRMYDYWGESYVTSKIMLQDATDATVAGTVEAAIEALPNGAFSDVTCTNSPGAAGAMKFFTDGAAAVTNGLIVACQLTSNPGAHRLPDIHESNLLKTGTTTPAAGAVVHVAASPMRGEDSDWANTMSVGTYSVTNGGTTVTGTNSDTLPSANGDAPKLVKIARQYVVLFGSSGAVTMDFAWPHDAVTTANIQISNAGVTKLTAKLVTGDVGTQTLTMDVDPTSEVAINDWLLVHNTFYRVSATNAGAKSISIDRPFYGKFINGKGVSSATDNVYKIVKPTNPGPYEAVGECSLKGLCDRTTGLCTCFKGYTNDNCDTQNMLAL